MVDVDALERSDLVARCEELLADLDLAGHCLAAIHMAHVIDIMKNK